MSDEYENNKSGYQAQSSEAITGSAGSASPDIDYVRPAESPEQDLYHGHTFITKWVFQDLLMLILGFLNYRQKKTLIAMDLLNFLTPSLR